MYYYLFLIYLRNTQHITKFICIKNHSGHWNVQHDTATNMTRRQIDPFHVRMTFNYTKKKKKKSYSINKPKTKYQKGNFHLTIHTPNKITALLTLLWELQSQFQSRRVHASQLHDYPTTLSHRRGMFWRVLESFQLSGHGQVKNYMI